MMIAQPDKACIAKALQSRLPFRGEFINLIPMAGDASNRRYFRIEIHAAPVSSLILMQLAGSEEFKASEEAVSGSLPETMELPFINVLKYLAHIGIATPNLYYFDEAEGLLYLEDFGDCTLLHACSIISLSQRAVLYAQAIDTLVHLHLHSLHSNDSPCLAFTRSFDTPLLMWEFDHFLEYGVEARQGRSLRAGDKNVIREECQKLAEWLASQPQVFTHRDYHSRNLMVHEGRLGVIDFQDALLGPATYDVASLLRDSYCELDETLIDDMLDRYRGAMCQGMASVAQANMLLTDPIAFRRLFDLTSIQRNLKAAGRFVYIDRVKGNSSFLKDIPRTLGYVRRNFEKYPELDALRTYLAPYVPEFQ